MASPLADSFGRNVARRRRLAGLSQEQLGDRAEMARSEVAAIERGLRLPRLDTILKMSAGLEASACELLTGPPRWRPGYRVEGRFGRNEASAPGEAAGAEA